MTSVFRLGLAVVAAALCAGCIAGCPSPPAPNPHYTYSVVNVFPHDRTAFTQGLLFADGFLYESTGMFGSSTVRQVELDTGTVLKQTPLDSKYFGEGLALYNERLYQLTWRNRVGFVYDKGTLQLAEDGAQFSYASEGWGLTFDGTHFILSDGSSYLRFIDPAQGFERPVRAVQVRDADGPVEKLNELEYVNGEVFANIWGSDYIARIAPDTGAVTAWIDMTGLLPAAERPNAEAVLNGIAYDSQNDRLFVTGKYWPYLYEVDLVSNH